MIVKVSVNIFQFSSYYIHQISSCMHSSWIRYRFEISLHTDFRCFAFVASYSSGVLSLHLELSGSPREVLCVACSRVCPQRKTYMNIYLSHIFLKIKQIYDLVIKNSLHLPLFFVHLLLRICQK